ncbi:MAG: hypothetical protein JXR73_17095 [Candidatus Omnitrophica bacterium]|nr:hypothetical protein [Candidatus Omnitrophota bacterium]
MDHQIQNLYERAQKLYQRVQNGAESHVDLFIDMIDCAYNLQQIKISVNYRRNNSGLTKEEQTAIEEIIQMAANTEQIIREMEERKSTSFL